MPGDVLNPNPYSSTIKYVASKPAIFRQVVLRCWRVASVIWVAYILYMLWTVWMRYVDGPDPSYAVTRRCMDTMLGSAVMLVVVPLVALVVAYAVIGIVGTRRDRH